MILWFLIGQKSVGAKHLKRNLQKGKTADFLQEKVRLSLYRPFTKLSLYFERMMTERVYVFPSIFPTAESEMENRVILCCWHW